MIYTRRAILFLLTLLLGSPLVAQIREGSYQAFKVEKDNSTKIITISVIPLGNGVFQFNEGDPRMPLYGIYHIIINSGDYHVGNFKKGIADGNWEKYYNDKLNEKSFYQNGRLDGKSVKYDQEGIERGIFTHKSGIPQHYISFHPNGKVEEERFYDEKGKLHGEIITYNPDGKITETERYQHGKLHGEQMKTDRSNGYIKTVKYNNGTKTGEYCMVYPNGNIYEKGAYDENGEKSGKWEQGEENGDKKAEEYYLNNKLHGEKRTYYSGNILKSIEEYANGELNGKKVEYDNIPNVVTHEMMYVKGRLNGDFKVYHNGILWREGTYKDGNIVYEKEYADGKLQIIKLLDENGTLVNVEKYDKAGKRTYKNTNYKKHSSIILKENAAGVIDIEIK